MKECNLSHALELWEQMTKLYPDEWLAWYSRGDCMARLCRYDEAIEYYSKGYDMQPSPKYTDSLEAISHIYEIQGKYDKGIKEIEKLIILLKNDWKTTEGEWVDYYKREIERLREIINK